MRIRLLILNLSLFVVLLFGACVAPVAAPTADGETGAQDEAAESSGEPTELVVSTWGFNQDVIDKNLTQPFEEANNVKIVYETGNNSERLTKRFFDSKRLPRMRRRRRENGSPDRTLQAWRWSVGGSRSMRVSRVATGKRCVKRTRRMPPTRTDRATLYSQETAICRLHRCAIGPR